MEFWQLAYLPRKEVHKMGVGLLVFFAILILLFGVHKLLYSIKNANLFDVYVVFISLYFGLYALIDLLAKNSNNFEPLSIISSMGSVIVILFILNVILRVTKITSLSGLSVTKGIHYFEKLSLKFIIIPTFVLFIKYYYATTLDFSDVIASSATDAARPDLPYWYVILSQFAKIAGCFVAFFSLAYIVREKQFWQRVIGILALLLGIYSMFSDGRRALFSFAVFAIYFLFLKIKSDSRKRIKFLFLSFFIGAVFLLLSNIYQTYRMLTHAGVRVEEMSEKYGVQISELSLLDLVDISKTANTFSDRTSMWEFNYLTHRACIENGQCSFSNGELMIDVAMNWFPSIFFENKLPIDGDGEVSRKFALEIKDWPTNIFNLLFTDFGYLSLLIGPFFLLVIFFCLAKLITVSDSIFLRATAFSMVWNFTAQIESGYMDWLGVLRNFTIIFIIYSIYTSVVGFIKYSLKPRIESF